jgi:hypothetical protein
MIAKGGNEACSNAGRVNETLAAVEAHNKVVRAKGAEDIRQWAG